MSISRLRLQIHIESQGVYEATVARPGCKAVAQDESGCTLLSCCLHWGTNTVGTFFSICIVKTVVVCLSMCVVYGSMYVYLPTYLANRTKANPNRHCTFAVMSFLLSLEACTAVSSSHEGKLYICLHVCMEEWVKCSGNDSPFVKSPPSSASAFPFFK